MNRSDEFHFLLLIIASIVLWFNRCEAEVAYQNDSELDINASLSAFLTPYSEYNKNHICELDDGTNGTVMYEKYCPASEELKANGQSLKRLCDYEVCRDLVCCPLTKRERLRQDCSYEHPHIEKRLQQSFECKIPNTGEDGFVTFAYNGNGCPHYNDFIKTGSTLPRVCDWTFCNTSVCCPISKLNNSACRYYTDWVYTSIEVVAGNCRMDGTGATGICRPLKQCPSQKKPNVRLTVCGRDCKEDFICCPEPDTKILSPGAASCAMSRQYAYEDQKIIKKFLPADVDNVRYATAALPSGGIIAEPKEFPHMATLGYLSDKPNSVVEWLCGGSLISDQFVLTAGHCLQSHAGFVKFVRLGIQDLVVVEKISRNTDCPEEFTVAERIPHPNYELGQVYNDIALLKLNRKVKFNQDIRPVCLPENSNIPSTVTAIGFGATGHLKERTEKLIKVEMSLFTHAACNDTFRGSTRKLRMGIVNETQFCAGSKFGIQDTCSGDSGGPIEAAHTDYYKMATIYGITSFGYACGHANSPSVYTRVFAFREWIEKVVWG